MPGGGGGAGTLDAGGALGLQAELLSPHSFSGPLSTPPSPGTFPSARPAAPGGSLHADRKAGSLNATVGHLRSGWCD